MYKGALFFDCDGTILDEQEQIYSPTDKTLRTLEKLRANGFVTYLTTGRTKRLTAGISNYFTGIITSNGAYVESEGKCIHNLYYDDDLQKRLRAYMDDHNIFYALETQKCSYITKEPNTAFEDVIKLFHMPKSIFTKYDGKSELKINKMSVYYNTKEELDRFESEFDGEVSIHKYRSCRAIDLDMIGISKGVGVKAVLDYFNIPKENAYAFGDGGNDLDMFRAVGHPVAMGIHVSELDAVAEFCTKCVKDEGVTHAICEHYGLV